MNTPPLVPVIAVHCFFQCGHVVRSFEPEPAHDQMESHYQEKHADDIADVLSGKIFHRLGQAVQRGDVLLPEEREE